MNKTRKSNRRKLKKRLLQLGLAGGATIATGVVAKKGFDKYQLYRKKKRVLDEIDRKINNSHSI